MVVIHQSIVNMKELENNLNNMKCDTLALLDANVLVHGMNNISSYSPRISNCSSNYSSRIVSWIYLWKESESNIMPTITNFTFNEFKNIIYKTAPKQYHKILSEFISKTNWNRSAASTRLTVSNDHKTYNFIHPAYEDYFKRYSKNGVPEIMDRRLVSVGQYIVDQSKLNTMIISNDNDFNQLLGSLAERLKTGDGRYMKIYNAEKFCKEYRLPQYETMKIDDPRWKYALKIDELYPELKDKKNVLIPAIEKFMRSTERSYIHDNYILYKDIIDEFGILSSPVDMPENAREKIKCSIYDFAKSNNKLHAIGDDASYILLKDERKIRICVKGRDFSITQ